MIWERWGELDGWNGRVETRHSCLDWRRNARAGHYTLLPTDLVPSLFKEDPFPNEEPKLTFVCTLQCRCDVGSINPSIQCAIQRFHLHAGGIICKATK